MRVQLNKTNQFISANPKGHGRDGQIKKASWFERSVTINHTRLNKGSLIDFLNTKLPVGEKLNKKWFIGSSNKRVIEVFNKMYGNQKQPDYADSLDLQKHINHPDYVDYRNNIPKTTRPITTDVRITPSIILSHQVPNEVKIALDEIFSPPLPSFESDDFIREIAKRGMDFIQLGGDCNVAILRNLNYVIKLQRDETDLKEGYQHNLVRIIVNDKIKNCVIENNFKHITYLDKFIYPLPLVQKDEAINDTNAIVVAPKVDIYKVNFQDLTDEEYGELVTVIAIVGYSDLRAANFTWIVGDEGKKLACIDTEDIAAKSVTSDRMLRMYCRSRWDIDCRWSRNEKSIEIAKLAESLIDDHPEVARQIIHQLQVFHRGLVPLIPKDNQIKRKEMFAAAQLLIEQNIQKLLTDANILFEVKLT
jgi:hypothetical protein